MNKYRNFLNNHYFLFFIIALAFATVLFSCDSFMSSDFKESLQDQVTTKVYFYAQNPDNSASYKLHETKTFYGMPNTKPSFSLQEYTGYDTPTFNFEVANDIDANGSSEYSVNYDLKKVTITFDFNGGSIEGSPSVIRNVSCLTQFIKPSIPARENYEFAGWAPSLPEKVPLEDTTYTAMWNGVSNITITPEDPNIQIISLGSIENNIIRYGDNNNSKVIKVNITNDAYNKIALSGGTKYIKFTIDSNSEQFVQISGSEGNYFCNISLSSLSDGNHFIEVYATSNDKDVIIESIAETFLLAPN